MIANARVLGGKACAGPGENQNLNYSLYKIDIPEKIFVFESSC